MPLLQENFPPNPALGTATSYYLYRQWINCKNGGYVEDYALYLDGYPANPSAQEPPLGIQYLMKSIYCLRGQLLDGQSKMANAELSVETLPGQNPPEGFQLPHNIPNSQPIVLADPMTGSVEAVPTVAIDPATAIAWRLDTQLGYSDLRTLRSLRANWVNEWSTLYTQINTQLAGLSASPPVITGSAITTFPGLSTNPAFCIAYFMALVLGGTQLIKPVSSGGYPYVFNTQTYKTPNSSGSPVVINPIVSNTLTKRNVGEGWPKTRGKMQSFGTHG